MEFHAPFDLLILKKILQWAGNNYNYVAYFTDNNIPYPHSGFKHQLFAGNQQVKHNNSLLLGKESVGILSYDYKNNLENLKSENEKIIDHPDEIFFLPEIKIIFNGQFLTIYHPRANVIHQEISNLPDIESPLHVGPIKALCPKIDYIENVNKIKQHIREGDIYELNYCIAFYAELKQPDPISLFIQLILSSPMPFSVYFKANDQVLLCASPERFLKKDSGKIIAQPIKGTIKRGITEEEDEELKQRLRQSEKEMAENLMIVDLMRNDLSKISETGSVAVEELFGIYSFQQVHQMISTVSATIEDKCTLGKVFKNTFPMGSMTGAPKIKCMELIDHYENFKRGWFSGTIGYINTDGDFDFNVIIRSIFIDLSMEKLLFVVGSAITYDADPYQEYEECLLKAQSIFEILQEGKKHSPRS